MSQSLRYYPYCATFDFECWFDTARLPSNSDKVQWVARHVPLSVSVASNVPGHEQGQCLVTDGDTNKLVSAMMNILRSTSDAAYENLNNLTRTYWRISQKQGRIGTNNCTVHDHPTTTTTTTTRNLDNRPTSTKADGTT